MRKLPFGSQRSSQRSARYSAAKDQRKHNNNNNKSNKSLIRLEPHSEANAKKSFTNGLINYEYVGA